MEQQYSVKPKYEFQNFRNQYYAVFSANFIMFSHGCILGWVAPALMLLTSDDTPLASGPLTLEELSWIGSMHCIGAIFGTFAFGSLTGFVGCKRAMGLLGIPAISYWVLIVFGNSVNWIIVARFVAGATGGGIFSITVLYIAEIADDRIRGTLGAIAQLCRNIGMLTSYIISSFLTYEQLPYVFVIIPIVYMINFILLPNTPIYLVKKEKFEKAEKALKYYKACDGSSVAESTALYHEMERIKALSNQRQANKKLQLQDFCERRAVKALAVAVVLSCMNQFSGIFTFLTYSGKILAQSGSSVNPYTSSIIFGTIQIIASLLTTQLADRWGRKMLLLFSLSGTVLGQISLAVYMFLNDLDYDLTLFRWVPVASLAFSIFIGSIGVIPLSSLCTVEVMPVKIRTIGMSVNTVAMNISSFVMTRYFPLMSSVIGLNGCLMVMAGICISGILFVIFVLEETNGKSLDSLEGCAAQKEKKLSVADSKV